MPTIAEIERQIAACPNRYIFWTKKEIRALPKILEHGETVRAVTSGFMNNATWLAVCTERRVLFINRGMFYGLRQLQIPLERIQAIDHEFTLVFGSITVWDGASAFSISMVLKSSIMPFVKTTQEQMYNLRSKNTQISAALDIATQLEKLADLKEKGYLTEEEFLVQKNQNSLRKLANFFNYPPAYSHKKTLSSCGKSGFTLIELSIALVIIGLIVGGILVGKDLIRAAEVRALISQKQSYDAAVNTFKTKYNYLPGDMPPSEASAFGFFTFTGTYAGKSDNWGQGFGNNNGRIEDYSASVDGLCFNECSAFWRHLSEAKLIAGSYGNSTPNDLEPSTDVYTTVGVRVAAVPKGFSAIFPIAAPFSLISPVSKYGNNNFFAVNTIYDISHLQIKRYENAYFLSQDNVAGSGWRKPSMSIVDIKSIDNKIDDGLPNTGKFLNGTTFNPSSFALSWSSAETSGKCTHGGSSFVDFTAEYNTIDLDSLICSPVFVFD